MIGYGNALPVMRYPRVFFKVVWEHLLVEKWETLGPVSK